MWFSLVVKTLFRLRKLHENLRLGIWNSFVVVLRIGFQRKLQSKFAKQHFGLWLKKVPKMTTILAKVISLNHL